MSLWWVGAGVAVCLGLIVVLFGLALCRMASVLDDGPGRPR